MSSWRKNLVSFDEKKANQWMARNSGKRTDPNQRVGARYVPNLETTKLPEDEFPGGYLLMRILPGISTNPCPNWIFTVQEYYLRDFVDILKRSDVPESHLEVFTDKIHSPATMDPKKEREDPLNALRRAAYEDNSEHCRKWAKKLFTKSRHYMNVIVRLLPLMDDREKMANYRNVGPRVFKLPQDPVETIMMAFKDPELGDPTDPDEAYDFKYWMERRKVPLGDREVWLPQYDHCGFSRKLTAAGSEEELEKWMTNLPNLHDEYVETSMKDLAQIADLCEMVVFDRIKLIHPSGDVSKDDDRPSDETENDDDVEASDSSGRSRRKSEDDDEAPRSRRKSEDDEDLPRSRRKSEDEEDLPRSRREEEEEAPRSRRRSESEEEEEAPRSRRRSEPEEEEEEAPRSRRRRSEPEEEEEEAPRSRRRRSEPEEDEEEAPRSRRRRSEPEEEEEEAPRSRRRRSEPEEEEEDDPKSKKSRARVAEDDDGDDEDDDWLDKKLANMEE